MFRQLLRVLLCLLLSLLLAASYSTAVAPAHPTLSNNNKTNFFEALSSHSPRPSPAPPRHVQLLHALQQLMASRLNPHPRLRLTPSVLERVSGYIQNDPLAGRIANAQRTYGLSLLTEPLVNCTRAGVEVSLLDAARAVLHRSYTLGMLYALDGDEKWGRRLVSELLHVTTDEACSDWNPHHFLDVAEMMHAVAIGWDWLYSAPASILTETQRTDIADGLATRGLAVAAASWGNSEFVTTYNWNLVCNGGMIAAALALADEPRHKDLALKILANATQHIALSLNVTYAPDGAWPEGTVYWGYATKYALAAITMLRTATAANYSSTTDDSTTTTTSNYNNFSSDDNNNSASKSANNMAMAVAVAASTAPLGGVLKDGGSGLGLAAAVPGLALTGVWRIHNTAPYTGQFDWADAESDSLGDTPHFFGLARQIGGEHTQLYAWFARQVFGGKLLGGCKDDICALALLDYMPLPEPAAIPPMTPATPTLTLTPKLQHLQEENGSGDAGAGAGGSGGGAAELMAQPTCMAFRLVDSQWNGTRALGSFRSDWRGSYWNLTTTTAATTPTGTAAAAAVESKLPAHPFWLAFKGGNAQANHNDADAGTFVFEMAGVRWAQDLGADSYGLPNYFSKSAAHGKRFSYYRKSTRGHNTLTFDGRDEMPGWCTQDVALGKIAGINLFNISGCGSSSASSSSMGRDSGGGGGGGGGGVGDDGVSIVAAKKSNLAYDSAAAALFKNNANKNKKTGPFALIDLTPVYRRAFGPDPPSPATEVVKRGYAVLPDWSGFAIRDEWIANGAHNLTWSMHFNGAKISVNISQDGRSAVMREAGVNATIVVSIAAGIAPGARFEVVTPIILAPQRPVQSLKKLVVVIYDTRKVRTLQVSFTTTQPHAASGGSGGGGVRFDDQVVPQAPILAPLNSWALTGVPWL